MNVTVKKHDLCFPAIRVAFLFEKRKCKRNSINIKNDGLIQM